MNENRMIRLTRSLKHWLFEKHPDKVVLIMFGHLELFTQEMRDEYIAWCKTDEGKQYLEGGSKDEKTVKVSAERSPS